MLKAANEPQKDQGALIEQNRVLMHKVSSLESALQTINGDKKGEDNETLLLKRKLALFEAKMKQLEEDKKMREVKTKTQQVHIEIELLQLFHSLAGSGRNDTHL